MKVYSYPMSVCDCSDLSTVDKEEDGSKYAAHGDTTMSNDLSDYCPEAYFESVH